MADLDRFSLFAEARERLGRALSHTLATVLPALAGAPEEAIAAGHRERGAEPPAMLASLRLEAAVRAQRALSRLYDLAFWMLETGAARPSVPGAAPVLLRDDDPWTRRLAEDLEQAIARQAGPPIDGFLARIDALIGRLPGAAHAPLGPAVLAAAAIEAVHPVPHDPGVRHALREALVDRLAPAIAQAILRTDAWLAAHGIDAAIGEAPVRETPAAVDVPVAPSVPITLDAHQAPVEPAAAVAPAAPDASEGPGPPDPLAAPAPSGAPAASGAADGSAAPGEGGTTDDAPSTDDGPMERAAEALVHATRVADVLGRHPFPAGRVEAGYRHATRLPRPEALLQDAVAFAHSEGVAPYTRGARHRWFDALRERMLLADAPPPQLAALDLVAALFDYVVDDARTPAAAQPLLWRLQQPAAVLAALDPGYLGDGRRSIRRLVEHVAAIAVAYADDVAQGSELHRRLETVVRAVEVVSHALQSRSVVLDEQVRKEYSRAAQGVETLVSRVESERRSLGDGPARRNRRDYSRRPSREQEIEVTRRLEQALQDRLSRCDVPESAREFLLGVWLRHLRTAVLRDGEDSPRYRLSLEVVDDLLWSLDASGARQSRRQLAERIPPLIRMLTQGVADIGARPEEFRPFLDELFVIHLRKMQKLPRDGGVTLRGPEHEAPPTLDEPIAPASAPQPLVTQPIETARAEESPSPASLLRGSQAGSAEDAAQALAAVAAAATAIRHLDGIRPPVEDATVPVPRRSMASPAPRVPARIAADPVEAPVDPVTVDSVVVAPADAVETDGSADAPAPSAPPALASMPDDVRPAGPSGEQRLLSVLGTVDLDDFPTHPRRLELDPVEAIATLQRGDWIELLGRDGRPQEVKVAWINLRRTVVLMVRRPDRRAMSLRVSELQQRMAQGRATRIA